MESEILHEFARLLFARRRLTGCLWDLAAALDCLGRAIRARRRWLEAFSHYTFALDDRQKSLSDCNPPTWSKKCWIKADGALTDGASCLSLSHPQINPLIWCWDGSAAHYWIQRSVDKTAEQSPLSYLPKMTLLWPSQSFIQERMALNSTVCRAEGRQTRLRLIVPPVCFVRQ